MNKILISTILVFVSLNIAAQTDSLMLLNEVRTKLKNGISVSAVLTDGKYLSIHPVSQIDRSELQYGYRENYPCK